MTGTMGESGGCCRACQIKRFLDGYRYTVKWSQRVTPNASGVRKIGFFKRSLESRYDYRINGGMSQLDTLDAGSDGFAGRDLARRDLLRNLMCLPHM